MFTYIEGVRELLHRTHGAEDNLKRQSLVIGIDWKRCMRIGRYQKKEFNGLVYNITSYNLFPQFSRKIFKTVAC
jgi:hypothetical protein